MPNIAQREFLDSLISEQGTYFETIRDNETFNLGTKILYLERAISQVCQTFNQSLDKLCSPDLIDEPKIANIEFIRSLKLINDLCFNNDVKYHIYGIKSALTHFFGSLGTVNPDDFKVTIQEIINARIAALSWENEKTVTTQKQARHTAEENIATQTWWRVELDLPLTQLAPEIPHFQPSQIHQVGINVIQVLNGALSGEQLAQLSEELRLAVIENASGTSSLVRAGVTVEFLQQIGLDAFLTFQRIASNQELDFTTQLVNALVSDRAQTAIQAGHLPVAELLQATRNHRPDFTAQLVHALVSDSAQAAIQAGHFPVAELLQATRNHRPDFTAQLVNALVSDTAQAVIQAGHLPVAELLLLLLQATRNYPPDSTAQLVNALVSDSAQAAIQAGHLPVAELLLLQATRNYPPDSIAQLVNALVSDSAQAAIQAGHLPVAKLLLLQATRNHRPDFTAQLVNALVSDRAQAAIQAGHLPVAELLQATRNHRPDFTAQLVNALVSDSAQAAIQAGHFPVAELLQASRNDRPDIVAAQISLRLNEIQEQLSSYRCTMF